MENIFSPEEVETMSAEIDQQLAELTANMTYQPGVKRGESPVPAESDLDDLFEKQFNTIEKGTGKNWKDFLTTFSKAAKGELCDDDGILYKQWDKWSDLTNPTVIAVFGGILAKMNLPLMVLSAVLVAVTVIVLRLGVKSFCKMFAE